MRAGTVGQLKGPFRANRNVFTELFAEEGTTSENMKIGVSINEQDLMPFGDEQEYPTGIAFVISSPTETTTVQMGRTGMYETDQPLQVNSLVFLNEAPESVIINYTIY